MCPDTSDIENGEIIVLKDGAYNEDTMRDREETQSLQGLLRRLPLTGNVGRPPLSEVISVSIFLIFLLFFFPSSSEFPLESGG